MSHQKNVKRILLSKVKTGELPQYLYELEVIESEEITSKSAIEHSINGRSVEFEMFKPINSLVHINHIKIWNAHIL
jgi:hypothetical protein